MGCPFNIIFNTVSGFFQRCFEKVGRFIGHYCRVLILLCIVLTAGLSVGILYLDEETDIEYLYTPVNSRAFKDRAKYQSTFPDSSGSMFLPYATTAEPLYAEIIFKAKDDNIFSNESMSEIRKRIDFVKRIQVIYEFEMVTFDGVCAILNGKCVISGEELISGDTMASYSAGNLTYPNWRNQDINRLLAQVNVDANLLISAKYFKVTFFLRQDTPEFVKKSKAWENQFLKEISSWETAEVQTTYAVSQSLNSEIEASTTGDIAFFAVTFIIMTSYACIVVGGDPVSSRTWAAQAGILAAGFGILSSLGLISLCGVKFVNIVGVMPFLVIGIGVDDMFLLMSSWADTYTDKDNSVVHRMGRTFRSAGIGITITSLTDLLAFVIGATSVFVSVRNFCIYMGVAVIFCYIYQCLFFGSCLALHGLRVDQGRHCITCLFTESRDQLRSEGKSKCTVFCCGGSKPTRRGQDERLIEKIPRTYLPKIILNPIGYAVISVLFLGYIGVSIWGVVNFKEGLLLKNLVAEDSYFYEYSDVNVKHFETSFSVAFVLGQDTNYVDSRTIKGIDTLFAKAKSDKDIKEDSLICWLDSYKESPVYSNATEQMFTRGLQLFLSLATVFKDDVIFGNDSKIVSSRCYLFTKSTTDSNAQADIMTRMRVLADLSPVDTYVFNPAFIYFEQFVSILPSTFQTVGIALAAMTVVTFIFLPHPLLVLLVVVNIVSILVGIFGFLHIWGLTLSSITMLHLIMSVGFSVDFSVHVCSAYMLAQESSRLEKTKYAITHAASPILNGAMSSFLGIIALVFTNSYIFNSFFKVMFTVIFFGAVHAVLFLPVCLCLIGPLTQSKIVKSEDRSNEQSNPNFSDALERQSTPKEPVSSVSSRL